MFKKTNRNIFVLEENFKNIDLEKRIKAAAETQRDEPESVMLTCQRIIQKANGSNVLVHALEHVGDLAHRAQAYNAIGNVNEKVSMMLQYWSPSRWTLEHEIEEGTISNCVYQYFKDTNQYELVGKLPSEERYKAWQDARTNPNVLKLIDYAKSETARALRMYVSAHEQYNQPITKLGMLGKQAAIALGNLEYSKLHKILLEMKQWVEKYYSSDEKIRWEMYSELI